MPENSPPTSADVRRLIESIGDLHDELVEHRRIVKNSNRLAWGSIVLAVVGVVCVIVALIVVAQNHASIRELEQARAEARKITCDNENALSMRLHEKLPAALLALAPPGTDLTAEQQARLDAYTASVVAGFPFRDCTPEGIAAYYSTPSTDPATNQ